MMNIVFKLEWLRLRRSLTAKLILAFTLAAALYAVWSGARWASDYSAQQQAFETQMAERMTSWRSTLAAIESGEKEPSPYDARPMNISLAATHTPGPLGHLAVGYRDLTPARLNISPWRNDISMVERYEFANPTTLALGTFDFAFFLVVVLPVLMIALSFDVIASDRSSGRMRLMLSNPVSLNRIVLSRLLMRNGLLALIVLVALVAGFLVAPASAGHDILLWTGVCLGYMCFWFALIFLVVRKVRRSESVAAGLVGAWILVVFAVPALVDTAAEALYPPPSKLAYLSVARLAEGDANKQTAKLTEGFLADHPDLSVGDDNVPGYFRGVFLANEAVREQTAPISAAFRQTAAKRTELMDILQYLSPSITAQRALYGIAQSDMANTRQFLDTGSDKLSSLGGAVRSAVISRNRVSLSQYDAIEPFQLAPISSTRSTLFSIIFLLVISAIFLILAYRHGDRNI